MATAAGRTARRRGHPPRASGARSSPDTRANALRRSHAALTSTPIRHTGRRGAITASASIARATSGRKSLQGDLTATADVALPAESRLEGTSQANNVEVRGTVKGNIAAKGKVRLGSHARVEGDNSTALAIAEGAVFIGTSVMGHEAD